VLEQCAAVIFRVDMRSCGVGRSLTAHLSFTNSWRELFLAVLQLAGTALSLRSTRSCGLLPGLQDPTYEADSRLSANIPYFVCNFGVNFTTNFGGVFSCFSAIVLACILLMNNDVK
jgi:hypothetical protein